MNVTVFSGQPERYLLLQALINGRPGMNCLEEMTMADTTSILVLKKAPDVLIVDTDLIESMHLDLIRKVSFEWPRTYIIVYVSVESDKQLFDCIDAGAHGYLLQNDDHSPLLEGIRDVMNGGAPLTSTVARRMFQWIKYGRIARHDMPNGLSEREKEILQHLVRGQSHKMIAGELHISAFTVSNHVKKIFRKLKVHSVSEVVATAINRQLV